MRPAIAIAPQQRLAPFKNNYAATHTCKLLQTANSGVPPHKSTRLIGTLMERAGPAGKIAAVRELKACKQGYGLPEYPGSQEKIGKVYSPVHSGSASGRRASGEKTAIQKIFL